MKKITISILLVFCLLFSFGFSVFATNSPNMEIQADGSTVYYNDDGTYTIITVAREEKSGAATRGTTKQVVGTVTATNCEKDDNSVNWTYTVYGTFQYEEGVSCVCVNSIYSYNINDDAWSFSNGSRWTEGNTAHGTGTFKKKVLFITVNTVDLDLSVWCDTYGNIYY